MSLRLSHMPTGDSANGEMPTSDLDLLTLGRDGAVEPWQPPIALVIGGSEGVGAALAESLLAREDVELVMVTSRRPAAEVPRFRSWERAHGPRVLALRGDVRSETDVAGWAARIRDEVGALDLCIQAAGLLHADGIAPERRLDDIDPASVMEVFEVNALGPLLAAKHLAPLMAHGRRAVFAALSARVGSISDNRRGGWYAYRASKAALNMFLRNIAIEMARKNPHFCVLGLHPGTVDTQLSKPFQRSVPDGTLQSPAQSAAQLIGVIDRSTPAHSGRVYDYAGQEISP